MSRQLLLGIAAAAALGAATLAPAAPASAQSWSLSIGTVGHHYGHGGGHRHGGFRDGGYRQVRPDGWHGGGWDRGHRGGWDGGWRERRVYGGGHGFRQQRCHVRNVRYWDGWGWVVDRRQVCN